MSNLSTVALRFGLAFVGVVLFGGAAAQWRSGATYGFTGKGRVHHDDEPGYFLLLLVDRVGLGIVSLATALLLRWT